MGNGYPDGIGCEAFDFEVLETVWRETTNSYNREHLATNFYDYMAHKPAEPDRYCCLVPEDQMLSRVARFKAAGLNTVAWWKPGNASICLKLRIVWVLDGRVGLLVVVRPFMRR